MTWMPGLLGVGGRAEGDEQRRVVLDGRVGVGHARAPWPGSRRARRRRRGPARRRPRRRSPSTSRARRRRCGTRVRNGSPWVRKPEPMISTPSSRSGRSRSPSSSSRAGSWVGSDICSTGMSAVGVHDLQRHPGAVVEAAAGVLVHRLAGRHHRRRPAGASADGVGGLVGHLVVPRREPAEVVDQRRAARPTEHDRRGLPVRADDEDRLRARQVAGPRGELAGPERVVEQRRGAVADVEGRHASRSCQPSIVQIQLYSRRDVLRTSTGQRPVDGRASPARSSSRLTRLNGREPKNPRRRRQRATGAPTRPRGPAPSSGLSDWASRPHRIAAQRPAARGQRGDRAAR